MNNLFGIGILLELRDQVSERLRRVSSSMENVQTEAERTVRSFNDLENSINNSSSSLGNISSATSNIRDEFRQTSSYTRSLERQMQRISAILGGEVPESTRQAYIEMFNLRREISRNQRAYGSWSIEAMEARNRLNEWALGLDDTTFKQVFMQSQLGLSNLQLSQQANSIKLNARMTKLMSSQTEILTQRMRGLAQHGVTPEMFMPPSTPGQFQILNETIKASQSPIYKLNAGYRAFGSSIEKTIKGWSAQKIAIKMANGDMERYGLLTRGITAGTMNLGLAFPVMGAMAVAGYGSLIKSVVEANEKLQKLIETVKGKVTKAFAPMREIVAKVTETVVRFVGKIADMIIKFNEAHPSCAKIIQGLALLLPALTTLLLPLGMIPIGLNAFKVALNGLWTLIGPFVAGIGTASSTALVLVGVIGLVATSLNNLWHENKAFRDTVKSTWKEIQTVITKVCDVIKKNWEKVTKALVPLGEAMFDLLKTVFEIGMTILSTIFNQGAEDLGKAWDSSWENILKTTTDVLNNITAWLVPKINAITEIIKSVTSKINEWWKAHGEEVTKTVLGAYEKVKTTIHNALTFLGGIVKSILDTFVTYWQENKDTIIGLVKTLAETVGKLVESMKPVIKGALDVIKTFWEEHGESILNTVTTAFDLVVGIIEAIAPVIKGILDGVTSFLTEHGDKIIAVLGFAWNFVSGLILSILNNIKGVIEGTLQVIGGIIDFFSALFKGNFEGMWEAIKSIFSGALEAIYNGVMLFFNVQLLGSLKSLVTGGIGLIKGMWSGIKNFFSTGVTACYVWVDDLVKGIINFFTNLGTTIPNTVNAIWSWIGNAFTTGCQWVASTVQVFIQNVVMFFSNLLANSTSIFSLMWNTVKGLCSAGVGVIKSIITGLLSAVSSILSSLVSVARTMFTNVFNTGKTLFNNLVSAVGSAMNNVISKVKSIMSQVLSYLRGISLVTIGKQMIQGLVNGISSMASAVVKSITGVVQGAISGAKKLLGIKSPSRVFKQIGAWTSEGMAIGVDNKAPLVVNSIEDMEKDAIAQANHLVNTQLSVQPASIGEIASSLAKPQPTSQATNNNTSVNNNFTINMTVQGNEDPKDLVNRIMEEINRKTQLKNTLLYNR